MDLEEQQTRDEAALQTAAARLDRLEQDARSVRAQAKAQREQVEADFKRKRRLVDLQQQQAEQLREELGALGEAALTRRECEAAALSALRATLQAVQGELRSADLRLQAAEKELPRQMEEIRHAIVRIGKEEQDFGRQAVELREQLAAKKEQFKVT